MSVLILRNRQRARAIDLKLLRRVALCLLKDLLEEKSYELGFHFVGAEEMATVNETFLQHTGSTDVITFDHSEEDFALEESPSARGLHGEIFICIDDAVAQAKEFKTSWQAELVRYVVHGVLHLKGFDDLEPALRRKMKREENRLVRELSRRFPLSKLQRLTKKTR